MQNLFQSTQLQFVTMYHILYMYYLSIPFYANVIFS